MTDIFGERTGVLSGLETCGSPWACAHCAASIRSVRAAEIGHILRAQLTRGHFALFLTLTLSHQWTDSTKDTLDAVMAAWRRMVGTRAWKRLARRWGFEGTIRNTEMTFGDSGAHPHHHIALLVERLPEFDPFDGGELVQLRNEIAALWAKQVARHGRWAHATAGVDLEIIRDAEGIGAYVSKIELELARGDLKRGRTTSRSPWQVALDVYEHGDPVDAAIWCDYVRATKGRRSISYSKGLLERFGLRQTTDEEAAETATVEPMCFLAGEVYDTLARLQALTAVRELAEAGASVEAVAHEIAQRTGRQVDVVEAEADDRVPTIAWRPPFGVEATPADTPEGRILGRELIRRVRSWVRDKPIARDRLDLGRAAGYAVWLRAEQQRAPLGLFGTNARRRVTIPPELRIDPGITTVLIYSNERRT